MLTVRKPSCSLIRHMWSFSAVPGVDALGFWPPPPDRRQVRRLDRQPQPVTAVRPDHHGVPLLDHGRPGMHPVELAAPPPTSRLVDGQRDDAVPAPAHPAFHLADAGAVPDPSSQARPAPARPTSRPASPPPRSGAALGGTAPGLDPVPRRRRGSVRAPVQVEDAVSWPGPVGIPPPGRSRCRRPGRSGSRPRAVAAHLGRLRRRCSSNLAGRCGRHGGPAHPPPVTAPVRRRAAGAARRLRQRPPGRCPGCRSAAAARTRRPAHRRPGAGRRPAAAGTRTAHSRPAGQAGRPAGRPARGRRWASAPVAGLVPGSPGRRCPTVRGGGAGQSPPPPPAR